MLGQMLKFLFLFFSHLNKETFLKGTGEGTVEV